MNEMQRPNPTVECDARKKSARPAPVRCALQGIERVQMVD